MTDESLLNAAAYILLALPLGLLALLFIVFFAIRGKRRLMPGFILLGLIAFIVLLGPLSDFLEPAYNFLLWSAVAQQD